MEQISKLFGLVPRDLLKSAITAVFAAVVVAVAGVASQPGFDVFTVDFSSLAHLIVNVSISTFVADIARRFATDSDGKLFGAI